MEDSCDYFDNVASQWDNMRVNFFSESLREKAMNLAGIAVGRIACDVGAGSGFMTEGLLKNGVKVIAIDYSEEMIEEIKKKFSYFPYIDCRVGDAEDLPVEDESVDYVFSNMCLHHVKNPPEAIKEMARILKIGGKVVISDLDLHNFEFLRTEQHDLWLGFDREDIRAWFINAGFNAVKVECADENCCSKSLSGAEDAKISIFIAHGIK
jgi:ubiquinone/menaquinone biosynthesis C-methylase UbiE